MNPMKEIKIGKITLNIGVGKNQSILDKALLLLKELSGVKPVKTITQKRIAQWGLRAGLPIGCKVTLRGEKAKEILIRLLQSKENILTEKQFDDYGNIAFGIPEYINIPGAKYNPEIGIIGLEVCITLERAGFRIKRRKNFKKKIPKKHSISRSEAIKFMQKEFNVKTGDEE
ncbi:50S ribosomal protein L5 [Candidatus Woesearchaeota archaeon]|nr:50S ribosomal protein L5 [Candidatus Woesearchaeota archaeon]MBL7050597.1 50S ribosomal protein L5 [Candidatus Woesearchaeota archaeon]